MKLRYIALSARTYSSGYEDELAINFRYYARFISNYLSKAVRKINIESGGYRMIYVTLSQKESDDVKTSEVDRVVHVIIHCSEDELRKIVTSPDEFKRYEHFLSFLEEGYRRSGILSEDQIAQLLRLHEQFRSGGYRNEWLFKKKPIREYGIYVYFKCYFTTYEFRLELEVYDLKQTRLLTKGIVMRTAPSEFCFDKDFKKIVIENGHLTVLDFLGHPNFMFDLVRLSAGDFHIYYCEPEEWEVSNKDYIANITRLKEGASQV